MYKILFVILSLASASFAQLDVVGETYPKIYNRSEKDTLQGIWVSARITDTRLQAYWRLNTWFWNPYGRDYKNKITSKGVEATDYWKIRGGGIPPGKFIELIYGMDNDDSDDGYCGDSIYNDSGVFPSKRFSNELQSTDSLDLYLTFMWTYGPSSLRPYDNNDVFSPLNDSTFEKKEFKLRTRFVNCSSAEYTRVRPSKLPRTIGRITPISNGWSVPQGKWTLRNLQGAEIPMRTEVSGDRLEVRPANGKRGAFVLQSREQAVPVVLP